MNLTTARKGSDMALIYSVTNQQQTNQEQCGRNKYLGAHYNFKHHTAHYLYLFTFPTLVCKLHVKVFVMLFNWHQYFSKHKITQAAVTLFFIFFLILKNAHLSLLCHAMLYRKLTTHAIYSVKKSQCMYSIIYSEFKLFVGSPDRPS